MDIFSKANRKLLTDPLNDNNPVTVQVLGICSSLAVTAKFAPAFMMGISLTVVVAVGNLVISMMRNIIPSNIKIIVQLIVAAALVIVVDQFLQAFSYDISKQLSVFVGLIITNCILMGRFEAFALANTPWKSFLDGLGNGLGYTIILVIVSLLREILGSGTITLPFGLPVLQVIPKSFYEMGYQNNGFMLLAPMALITLGVLIWIQRSKNTSLIEEH